MNEDQITELEPVPTEDGVPIVFTDEDPMSESGPTSTEEGVPIVLTEEDPISKPAPSMPTILWDQETYHATRLAKMKALTKNLKEQQQHLFPTPSPRPTETNEAAINAVRLALNLKNPYFRGVTTDEPAVVPDETAVVPDETAVVPDETAVVPDDQTKTDMITTD